MNYSFRQSRKVVVCATCEAKDERANLHHLHMRISVNKTFVPDITTVFELACVHSISLLYLHSITNLYTISLFTNTARCHKILTCPSL